VLFKSKKVIGLDIGSSSIKIVELDGSKSSATLQKFSIIQTPSNGLAMGEIIDPKPVADAIVEAMHASGIKSKKICTGLWGPSVMVKKISIPKMEKSLLQEQIRWEAEQYIPFELAEINLDYQVLNTSQDANSMDILLVAAKKEQITRYLEIIQMAELELAVLDLNGFALANTFELIKGKIDNPIGVLNVGSIFTNFVVIKNSEVLFCRDIAVGGDLYTNEVQKGLGVTIDEAENLKLDSNNAPENMAEIIQQTHESFCDEILASIDFFHNTTPGVRISKLYITGGSSRINGLMQAMASVTQLECEGFDPLEKVNINKSLGADFKLNYGDYLAVVIGLGLRKLGDTK
jgi:type IV pilus assembly protein PilM